jgi:large subunit ribosomal protein L21e
VDIKVNGAVHKGMPHKVYQGRTATVWNISKGALGVEVNKPVHGRILKKRFNVRIEHVKPSRCREDYLNRILEKNDMKKIAASLGEKYFNKRQPVSPENSFTITNAEMVSITPIPYDIVKEGLSN